MVTGPGLELDDSLFEEDEKKKGARLSFSFSSRDDKMLLAAVILGVLFFVLCILLRNVEKWWIILLLGLVFLASELFALPMKGGGRLSLAFLPVIVAIMYSGPMAAALVPLFGIPIFYMERGEEGVKRIVFNTAQYVAAAGAAALVFWHTPSGSVLLRGGEVDMSYALSVTTRHSSQAAKLILPWLLATLVFYIINTALVTPVLAGEQKVVRFWEKRMLPKLPSYVLYAVIGFLAAVLYSKVEITGVILLAVPLIGMRVVYTRYSTMRDVCDDTTLAVMEAVEAGGMFSEGHSIGVSDIAVAIAEEMNFHDEDLHYLRQAALLHDIGKLALDPSLVDKPGPLTPEEFEAMKQHPLVGASIVSKEPSFAVVAPTITHHHEMVDGSGYPDGLSGETIPMGARILSVADAFDAMQRPSPYREPLNPHQAASEIIRTKGVQFDPDVVDAFIKVVTKEGLWTGSLKDKVKMPETRALDQQTLPTDTEQPTLEEAIAAPEEAAPAGATPAEGTAYEDVRGEIEKDIREWKRIESDKSRRRSRGESKRKQGSLRKKKGSEGEGSEE